VIDLGNCGVPEFARKFREMGGFVAYLPNYLQAVLQQERLEAIYKELMGHEVLGERKKRERKREREKKKKKRIPPLPRSLIKVWVRHKFRIGSQILEGKRDSLVLREKPKNPDRAEFSLDYFTFARLLLRVAEEMSGCTFQSILIHRYDPVKHSLGFHSDETHTETYDEHGQVCFWVSPSPALFSFASFSPIVL